MCGIAGVIGDNKSYSTTMLNMIESLSHRGKDSLGSYKDDNALLYHTRLAILGIEDGHQPVLNQTKTIVSVANGEIYNYRELTASLKKLGYVFSDACDTNIIPHLYEAYGTDMFKMINGQFAIAIWDKNNEKLILARDKFGEKPLYYRKIENNIFFSSEITPLLIPKKSYEINAKCLKDICTTWVPIRGKTLYKDINSVDSGQYLIIEKHRITSKYYYAPTFLTDSFNNKSKTELLEELDTLLKRSVLKRINTDVPISFYLSGGLDSSLIAAIASEYIEEKMNTFSISFSDNNLDEAEYQKVMSEKLNSKHRQLKITDAMIIDNLYNVILHLQTPILRLGAIPMYLLAEFVHNNGFKVALSGEGADELFGGYDIFKEAKIRAFCERDPKSKLRPLLYKKTNSYINNFNNNNSAALATFFNQVRSSELFSSHAIRFQFGEYCSQFFSDTMKKILKDYSVKEDLAIDLPSGFENYTNISKAQYLEIKTFMSNYLLSTQGDRVSMAHSMECRYPFLDNDVAAFAFSLNDRYKINVLNEKYILKELAKKYLPDEIINRKKFPYRAMISGNSLLNNEKVSMAVSEESLKKYDVFNSIAVTRFFNKVRSKNHTTEKEMMLLLFIISTQILLNQNDTVIHLVS
ncbi:asparagine synthase (glutamine-hydrolyzing) [Bacillus cereus]|uniref:asparagine synthase (glutamine-hydrolyzing) n=1 Tax=Bacillus cereus (strain VD014) TaxID=1053223 RepID=A0A9W5NMN8_BACC8|nr:asparagine synthase (glutamine-hydrolyzing) [Bacillus cereus]EJR13614.1 asparagine synthase (glutamine-hydrolyzing) [Bacillus cereus VD014]MDA2328201.1 asparagine synthase (glutamine-hydrolyzing) [Bacillus cereus]MDA2333999.1 asparagine synthase (glutamine-hydrolyzing) [Bacillus cereus]MDA2358364.1 asparagine synthase (glutamine-hydrolyzing) [Bacillus cereus]HDR8152465.1 asparagine synthase (glutamine-hydrolyzing) [Bacillus cereus]